MPDRDEMGATKRQHHDLFGQLREKKLDPKRFKAAVSFLTFAKTPDSKRFQMDEFRFFNSNFLLFVCVDQPDGTF